jgi:hypothetical protein
MEITGRVVAVLAGRVVPQVGVDRAFTPAAVAAQSAASVPSFSRLASWAPVVRVS